MVVFKVVLNTFLQYIATVYGGLGGECDGLNDNGPNRCIVCGVIRKCTFVGATVSLGVSFEVSNDQA